MLTTLMAIVVVALGGTVRAADGSAVAGASVTIQQAGRVLTAVTNERGEFELPAGTLPATVEVRAAGFRTSRVVVTASPVEITLEPSGIRESILVTGATLPETWRRPDTGTTVIRASTLDALPGITLDESLRIVAGFSLFRRSSARASNPTTHGVTMRGLSASGASRGLVLIDGTPLTEGFGGWVTWTRMPAMALEAIEIDRGAHGSTFGSDALGGVINLSSGSVLGTTARVGAYGGSFGTRAVDLAGGRTFGRATAFAAASWFDTDGIIPVAPESRGPVDVPADARWASVFAKGSFAQNGQRLTFSGLYSGDDRGNGTPLQRNHMQGGTGSVGYDATLSGTQVAARLSMGQNGFEQSFSAVSGSRVTETFLFSQDIDINTVRAVLEAGRAVSRAYVTGRATIARARADFSELRPPNPAPTVVQLQDDSDAIAVHAGLTPRSSVTIGAGVRTEWRRAPALGASSDSATVGNVSAAWTVSPRVSVRGAAATSHRWPTLNELVRSFQAGAVLTLANPDLGPERARSAEAALSVSGRGWLASVGGFWTRVEGAVANVTIQTTPSIIRQRRNAGEAKVKGAEIDFDWRPVSRAHVRAGMLFVDSRFRNSLEPALEGNRLPQVPRVSFSLSGDVQPISGFTAAFVWRALGSQYDDDRNVFLLAEAYQFDVRASYRTGPVNWHLTVENLFDSRVEVGRTPLVTLAPGRAVRAGATWIWK